VTPNSIRRSSFLLKVEIKLKSRIEKQQKIDPDIVTPNNLRRSNANPHFEGAG